MLKEKKFIEKKIVEAQERLSQYPPGKLICVRNGKHHKWFKSDGHTKTYIPKSDRQLAEQLAAKKYHAILLDKLISEKRAIDSYIRHYDTSTDKMEKLFAEDSGYRELLVPYFLPVSEELKTWEQGEYRKNLRYPEQLVYKAASGHLVRSKSEMLIAMLLYTERIPFRYECILQLGEIAVYPDFTIRHPRTGEFFWWEHFGMMDKPSYVKNMAEKLQLYAMKGIIPSVHLITTYETKDHPLDAEWTKKIIAHYFL